MSMGKESMNDVKEFVCDYWENETEMTVGTNRLQGQIEIDINGNHIYLDDSSAESLIKHLQGLLNTNKGKFKIH